ncbi:hypothetical protein KR044_003864 [Drosophila immigrans]|nr:hypothetical protein KR044_003864 [Drosophila immigrans]
MELEPLNEMFDVMIASQRCLEPHHLAHQVEMYSAHRAMLINWLCQVDFFFRTSNETFPLTVSIVDRYLAKVHNTTVDKSHLLGLTAMMIACKYEELHPPPLENYRRIHTDIPIDPQKINDMVIHVLQVIDFRLSAPLPYRFLCRYLAAIGRREGGLHANMAKYILEFALLEYELVSKKPSELAAAALFLALILLHQQTGAEALIDFSHCTADDLRPIVQLMARLVILAPIFELSSVFHKYCSSRFERVALRAELNGALLFAIAETDISQY